MNSVEGGGGGQKAREGKVFFHLQTPLSERKKPQGRREREGSSGARFLPTSTDGFSSAVPREANDSERGAPYSRAT